MKIVNALFSVPFSFYRSQFRSLVSLGFGNKPNDVRMAMSEMSIPDLIANVEILYQDDHLIALNKPSNMLSVPGRVAWNNAGSKPRVEEWKDSIAFAAGMAESRGLPELKDILDKLCCRDNIPRKKERFVHYLQRVLKVEGGDSALETWDLVEEADHRNDLSLLQSLPRHVVSAADIAEMISGSKVFHVHRLDMETSGGLTSL
jgi:hypothetical protein